MKQVPRAGAVTEAVDFVPQQILPPGTDHLSCGTTGRIAGQHREACIVYLVQMKDAFDADQRHEDAGQETAL
jgi:hypothetical protein